MTGLFVTLEGGEGAGKSTQIASLATALAARGHEVVSTREPGGSPGAERIRSLILDPSADVDDLALAMLFSAARRDHVVATIAPALARGAVVLCDRFIDSTRAYQGAAGFADADALMTLERLAIGDYRPHLTLIIDIPPEEGMARAVARHGWTAEGLDRFESRKIGFHRAVRDGFLSIAAREPDRCIVVDGTLGQEAVFGACLSAIEQRLQK